MRPIRTVVEIPAIQKVEALSQELQDAIGARNDDDPLTPYQQGLIDHHSKEVEEAVTKVLEEMGFEITDEITVDYEDE